MKAKKIMITAIILATITLSAQAQDTLTLTLKQQPVEMFAMKTNGFEKEPTFSMLQKRPLSPDPQVYPESIPVKKADPAKVAVIIIFGITITTALLIGASSLIGFGGAIK